MYVFRGNINYIVAFIDIHLNTLAKIVSGRDAKIYILHFGQVQARAQMKFHRQISFRATEEPAVDA